MARNFDGVNDVLNFGTDPGIDGFTTQTIAMYVRRGATGVGQQLVGKDRNNAQWVLALRGSNDLSFNRDWSGATNGAWDGNSIFTDTAALTQIVLTYDGGSTANDPTITVNNVAETITETETPAGALVSDATPNLLTGESGAGTGDFTGDIGWLVYANAIWDAAQKNRHRWWGRPGGGIEVYHPLVTDKLANEGSATANGTATGTTVAAMAVPVVRPGTAMMGAIIGW